MIYQTTSPLKGRQKWDVIWHRGGGGGGWGGLGVSECSGRLIFVFFLIIKIGWLDIMLSETVIYHWQEMKWSHPFMRSLDCLWVKSNKRMRGVFECNVTWYCFCFGYICSYARCVWCFIVCLQLSCSSYVYHHLHDLFLFLI